MFKNFLNYSRSFLKYSRSFLRYSRTFLKYSRSFLQLPISFLNYIFNNFFEYSRSFFKIFNKMTQSQTSIYKLILQAKIISSASISTFKPLNSISSTHYMSFSDRHSTLTSRSTREIEINKKERIRDQKFKHISDY